MRVAEGRRARCPPGGESCASDSHVDVECTIVRPSATGQWVACVREARPLMSDEGNAGMGCTRRKQNQFSETKTKPDATDRNVSR